jgi:predicted O-methyltransferase YrrM
MNREELVKSIVSRIPNGIFVEIGTHTGDFADFILSNSTNSTVYCLDPYINYKEYDDRINEITGDDLFNSVQNKLKSKFGDRVIFIRKFSEKAVDDIPNDIDFLYIDGNHRYTYVLKDLELFFPKVKHNHIIVGDDAVDHDETKRNQNGDVRIDWNSESYGHYGVIKAFREFCNKKKLQSKIIGSQYLVVKS